MSNFVTNARRERFTRTVRKKTETVVLNSECWLYLQDFYNVFEVNCAETMLRIMCEVWSLFSVISLLKLSEALSLSLFRHEAE